MSGVGGVSTLRGLDATSVLQCGRSVVIAIMILLSHCYTRAASRLAAKPYIPLTSTRGQIVPLVVHTSFLQLVPINKYRHLSSS